MNKQELIEAIAKSADISKASAERAMACFTECVINTCAAGEKVVWPKFGSWVPGKRAARTGRSPITGEEIQIKACNVVKFRVGQHFKDCLNKEAELVTQED